MMYILFNTKQTRNCSSTNALLFECWNQYIACDISHYSNTLTIKLLSVYIFHWWSLQNTRRWLYFNIHTLYN